MLSNNISSNRYFCEKKVVSQLRFGKFPVFTVSICFGQTRDSILRENKKCKGMPARVSVILSTQDKRACSLQTCRVNCFLAQVEEGKPSHLNQTALTIEFEPDLQ